MFNSAASLRVVSETETHAEAGAVEAPTIDLVHLSRQTFGDHELERELLTLFERQATQFAARLASTAAPAASVGRAELVHTLKGSARAIGALGVAAAAQSYEDALSRGESPSAAGAQLEAAIEAARRAIADLLKA